MRCPVCSSEMDYGKAYIRGTALGFLVVGLSHQHCWFKSHATGRKKIIARSGSGFLTRAGAQSVNPQAYHCEDCGTSVIMGAASTQPQLA